MAVAWGFETLRDSIRHWYGANGKLMAVELVRDTANTGWGRYSEHEEYWYDALGRRVWVRMHRGAGCALWAKETGCRSSVTRTVWDDAALLAEIRTPATSPEADTGTNSGAHAGRVAYLNGGAIDRPLALLRLAYGTEVILPHRNYRGLVDTGTCLLGAIDCSTIEWPAATYTAYMASPTASDTGPAHWMGSVVTEQKDGSGLLYRRNRYVDPATGRFTQEDPIGLAGGLNLYGFAGGDPVNFSDPFGLCEPLCSALDAALLAADINDIRANGANAWNVTGVVLGTVCTAAPVVSGCGAIDDGIKRGARAVGGWLSRASLRRGLVKITGGAVEGAQAHHIFPHKFADQFRKLGLDVNEGKYGAWWEKTSHLQNARAYNDRWATFLAPKPTRDQVMDFGRALAREYGLDIHF